MMGVPGSWNSARHERHLKFPMAILNW